MTRLISSLSLAIALILGSGGTSSAQNDPILDKESATQVFSLSSAEWAKNVAQIQTAGFGRASRNPNGSWTLIYRPDPQRGILLVTPSYHPNELEKPFKIDVVIVADRLVDRVLFETASFNKVKSLIEETAQFMMPEFSVIGYLLRDELNPPSLNFTIFQTGKFPSIDAVVRIGDVCPPLNGRQECIKGQHVDASGHNDKVLARCAVNLGKSQTGVGKTETELNKICSCIAKAGKLGLGLDEVQKKCLK